MDWFRRMMERPQSPVAQEPEPSPPEETQDEPTETFDYFGYEVPVELAEMTGGGPETFESIAAAHLDQLRQWIDLQSSDHVLEIGCGVGRDAIPLTAFLESGSYVGVDVIGRSIDWLVENVGPDRPDFSFLHLDVKDRLHNPDGSLQMTDLRLPIEDSSIDKVFLFSVFTHLFLDEVEHYLSEFKRVLKPGGMVFASVFVVNDDVLASARETDLTAWQLRFEHEHEHEGEAGVYINTPEMPRGAVAYTYTLFDRVLADSGLETVEQLNGSWSGFHEHADGGQDAVTLRKTG